MASVFVGRKEEQSLFESWVASEARRGDRRAGILIGSAQSGKTALLDQIETLCLNRSETRWYVQRDTLNSNETPSAFFERVLSTAYTQFHSRFLSDAPSDRRLLRDGLREVPKIGALLASQVNEDRRPAWMRFIYYMTVLSQEALREGERLIVLIDPNPTMQSAQAEEWLSVAEAIPDRVRLLIAQRPDDVLSTHPDARLRFTFIPRTGALGDLSSAEVSLWYAAEAGERLALAARRWSPGAIGQVAAEAYARYGGHPAAHAAIIGLLAREMLHDPVRALTQWPSDLADLMDRLFVSLANQGPDRLRAALSLQVLSVATPLEVWSSAAGMPVEALIAALGDGRYVHFFHRQPEYLWEVFHRLFGERLEQQLEGTPTRAEELAEAAWAAVMRLAAHPAARQNWRDQTLAAGTRVALRFGDPRRARRALWELYDANLKLGRITAASAIVASILERVAGEPEEEAKALVARGRLLRTLGQLSEAESDVRRALVLEQGLGVQERIGRVFGHLGVLRRMQDDLEGAEREHRAALGIAEAIDDAALKADQYSGLGLVLQKRPDVDGAERMHRRALELDERLDRREELARDRGNLGNVLLLRPDLVGSEGMHRRALELYEELGSLEGRANAHNNLGIVLTRRGLAIGAEVHFRKALELNERLGRPLGVASTYGNLAALYRVRKDVTRARQMHGEALAIAERLGNRELIADQFVGLGQLARDGDEREAARAQWTQARKIFSEIGMAGRAREVRDLLSGLDS